MTDLGTDQRPIFLFTHPRTASNLLLRLFAKHPRLAIIEYPWHDAFMTGPERLMRRITSKGSEPHDHDILRSHGPTYQDAFDQLKREMSLAAKQGKVPLIKDHIYFFLDPKVAADNIPSNVSRLVVDRPIIIDRLASESALPDASKADMLSSISAASTNPTILPDSFMSSVTPLVLIRHPARIIPSFYRAASEGSLNIDVNDEDFPVNASLRWSRLVFDWYADRVPVGTPSLSQQTKDHQVFSTELPMPIVLDADDIINDENVVSNLCHTLGLDPLYLQFSWERAPTAEQQRQSPMLKRFLSTLQESTGIIRKNSKDEEIDIAKEAEAWIEEFGSHIGEVLKEYTELAMHDYYYLREFRLRPS